MRFIFMLPLLTAIMVSCGKASSPSDGKKTVKITQEEIDTIMNNQSFSCDKLTQGECPSGIARLFILDLYRPEKSGVCTGFMIDDTTMVTNNHCVPNQRKCDTTFIAVHDGNGGYTRTKCGQVLATKLDYSNPSNPKKSLDYTVLTTEDHIPSEAMEISHRGVTNGESVSAFVVDHQSLYDSRISQFNCVVNTKTGYSSIVLESCPVIGGNSGSPVINENGKVVGVIWGSNLDDSVDAATPMWQRRSLSGMALMTDILRVNGL